MRPQLQYTIEVVLAKPSSTPATRLADAAIVLTDGPLASVVIAGFTVWAGQSGRPRVTFPSRTYDSAAGQRRFSYLRARQRGNSAPLRALREAILAAYREAVVTTAVPSGPGGAAASA